MLRYGLVPWYCTFTYIIQSFVDLPNHKAGYVQNPDVDEPVVMQHEMAQVIESNKKEQQQLRDVLKHTITTS